MLPWWIVFVLVFPIAAVSSFFGLSNGAMATAQACFLILLVISVCFFVAGVLGRAPLRKASPARILAGIWSPLCGARWN